MNKIMIVDDEVHVLRILKVSLEKQGYQVETHNNGLDALEALARYTPDVLITDIQMPRMSGEELCHQIEEKYPQREFLIFVLTSRTEVEHREWSARINNLKFMEKPVSIRNLLNQLSEYFNEEA
ncbi:MAG: response regulator [Gammaproteobacteria bacterium]|nr:response regulator [Gammaproteobacteria bacterium]